MIILHQNISESYFIIFLYLSYVTSFPIISCLSLIISSALQRHMGPVASHPPESAVSNHVQGPQSQEALQALMERTMRERPAGKPKELAAGCCRYLQVQEVTPRLSELELANSISFVFSFD